MEDTLVGEKHISRSCTYGNHITMCIVWILVHVDFDILLLATVTIARKQNSHWSGNYAIDDRIWPSQTGKESVQAQQILQYWYCNPHHVCHHHRHHHHHHHHQHNHEIRCVWVPDPCVVTGRAKVTRSSQKIPTTFQSFWSAGVVRFFWCLCFCWRCKGNHTDLEIGVLTSAPASFLPPFIIQVEIWKGI